jgi:hypothetical protein
MPRSVQVVRLLAAVAIAHAACWFAVFYDGVSRIRFQFDHPRDMVIGSRFGEFVAVHGTHAHAVPLLTLLVGILIIWRWPKSQALMEALVSSLWILSLVWAGLILINWQVQNIPTFSGMRLHY